MKAKDGNGTAESYDTSCFGPPLPVSLTNSRSSSTHVLRFVLKQQSELKEQAITIDLLPTCEKTNDHASRLGHVLSGLRRWFHHFCLTEEPALSLPSPPSDK